MYISCAGRQFCAGDSAARLCTLLSELSFCTNGSVPILLYDRDSLYKVADFLRPTKALFLQGSHELECPCVTT